jgi:hypothetical protein
MARTVLRGDRRSNAAVLPDRSYAPTGLATGAAHVPASVRTARGDRKSPRLGARDRFTLDSGGVSIGSGTGAALGRVPPPRRTADRSPLRECRPPRCIPPGPRPAARAAGGEDLLADLRHPPGQFAVAEFAVLEVGQHGPRPTAADHVDGQLHRAVVPGAGNITHTTRTVFRYSDHAVRSVLPRAAFCCR